MTGASPDAPSLPEIQSLWDYDDPAASERRFRAALVACASSPSREYRLELITQIARTHSLRHEFDEAHKLLDQTEAELTDDTPRARLRYLLERGRAFNSAGARETARPLFLEAWKLGRQHAIDGLAVDAAHMVANASAPDEAIEWNVRAIDLATDSQDPDARRWVGSLCNNLGWAHHEHGDFEAALRCFELALDARIEQGRVEDIRAARWCIARCQRSLGQTGEALLVQRELESEHAEAGSCDGYVLEEIAECLLALDQSNEARPYFRRAYAALSADAWFAEHESARLKRLKMLGDSSP